MPYYALTRTRGPAWDRSRPMLEQDQWAAHAAFMNALVDDGFVVVGGPIGDGERTLLMVDAPSEEAIHDRLATDPWTPMGLLSIVDVQPWQILLGRDA